MKKIFVAVLILLIIVLGLLLHVKSQKVATITPPQMSAQNTPKTIEKVESALPKVKITFLDIGQGDASFVEFPDGGQMLVDCAQDSRIMSALSRVMPYYDHDLDYLIITHPDSDHYGGCIDVLRRLDVKNIIYSGLKKEKDDFWQAFWDAMQKEGAVYRVIDRETVWNIASSSLHFYFPNRPVQEIIEEKIFPRAGDNNTSIIFNLDYEGKKILFMADAQVDLENYLIKTYGNHLDSDVLKVGHHGSGGSSHQEFLDLVSPVYAVISVGKDNDYGHPSVRVLKKLERVESRVFRTDESGDVVCEVGETIKCD